MAWDVAISALLLAIGSITLPYSAKEGRIVSEAKNSRLGFAAAAGAAGAYLFVCGVAISFTWPFSQAGGVYNVLFGGVATFGGLIFLSGAVALALNADLRPVTYFAAVVGVYAVVDAAAIIQYGLTREPLMSALSYLAFAAPAILSAVFARLESKRWRLLFAVFAFFFAAAWLLEATSFTFAHLNPT